MSDNKDGDVSPETYRLLRDAADGGYLRPRRRRGCEGEPCRCGGMEIWGDCIYD